MAEDNTVFVLQKALLTQKAKVRKGSVKEFFILLPLLGSISISLVDLLNGCIFYFGNHGADTNKGYYVNGYRFPRKHKINDIEYFTEEITSLTMERIGQEACACCK